MPRATPARSSGNSAPSCSAASTSADVESSSASVSGATSIAASPIIFTSRTGATATSAASSREPA